MRSQRINCFTTSVAVRDGNCTGEVRAAGRQSCRGFSLIEVLVVMGIITLLTAMTVPAIYSLSKANGVDRAAADVVRVLELSRSFAMAHQTYVRVGISQVQGRGLVLLPIYPLNGSLDADTAADMNDYSKWGQLIPAVFLEHFQMNDNLQALVPSTIDDREPSESDIPSFRRKAGGTRDGGQDPEFSSFIQFNPNGEARVLKNTVARHVKIGMSRSDSGSANPLIVRLSGTNGAMEVLRKEDVQ
jgi:prepilin-type N-terminal cleavage/methylation domain-containing protein